MKKIITLFLLITVILTSNAQTDCNPATITNVAHEGTGNRITWTMPTSGEEEVISQSGVLGTYPIGDKSSFGVYHRFTIDELVAINGGQLTQIVFAPSYYLNQTVPGHTYTIQIYIGGIWGEEGNRNPGTLLVSQELENANLLFNEENTITLETPVTIDASQELWIGYYCTSIDLIPDAYKYPVGADVGPRNEGFGNIIFFQNQWNTLYELYSTMDINFYIKGKVKTIEGESVNIYCNNITIADDILGTTYFHSNPTGEENCYKVEVNCLEGVSILSNEVCIDGVGIKDNEQKGKFTVYPNPAKNELQVTSYELQVTSVEIFDVYGRNVGANLRVCPNENKINISALSAGIYFIRIIDESGVTVQRFVKE